MVLLRDGPPDVALGVPRGGPLGLGPAVVDIEAVFVVVEVHDLISVEVHAVRAHDPAAAEDFGVIDLERHGLPAAVAAAGEHSCPGLADAAVSLLDVGDQLLRVGVAAGSHIGAVDPVHVVVVHVGVSRGDDDHLRGFAAVPPLGDRFVSAVAERGVAADPVTLIVEDGVLLGGVIVRGEENVQTDVHVGAPELAEDLALDLVVDDAVVFALIVALLVDLTVLKLVAERDLVREGELDNAA